MLGLNRVLTAEQRVYKAQMALNSHRTWVPFIGIRMIGTVTVVESLPPHHTASTNGRDVILCRAFVDSLTDAEL